MPSAAIGCVRGDAKGRIIRFLRVDMGIGLHKFDEELFHRVCETAISIIEPRLSCEISVVAIKLAEFCSGRGIVGLPVTYHADPYHQPCKSVSCQQYK